MSKRRRSTLPDILYVDEHLVVVDKPPGVLSVPGRGNLPNAPTLLRASRHFADDEPLRVVHRLDKDASGVLLFARTLAAQRNLVAQFMERHVRKIYHALVSGYVEQEEGVIELSLCFNQRENRMRASSRRGKPSLTHYRVLERVPGHTWLECRPATGRMHQIRAHLAAIGHPLSIDPEYGGGHSLLLSHYKPNYKLNRRKEEIPLIARLTLHASRLEFIHPHTGENVTFETPLPKDLRVTLLQLGRLS
ncbi:MAG: RluA family pseudouridine synthase [Planctomycetota bacterium]